VGGGWAYRKAGDVAQMGGWVCWRLFSSSPHPDPIIHYASPLRPCLARHHIIKKMPFFLKMTFMLF